MNQEAKTVSRPIGGQVIRNPHFEALRDFQNKLAGLDITRQAHKFLWDKRAEIESAFTGLASSFPCEAVRMLVTLDDENSVRMTHPIWEMFLPHIEHALSRSDNDEQRALACRDVLLAAPDDESQNNFLIKHAEDLSDFLLVDLGLSKHFNLRNYLVACESADVLEAYSPYLQEYFYSQDNLHGLREQKEQDDHIVFVKRLLKTYEQLGIDPPDYLIDARQNQMKRLVSQAFELAARPKHDAAQMTNVLLSASYLGIQPGDPIRTEELETPTANVKLFHLDTTHIPDTTGSLYVLCQSYKESGDIRPLLIARTDASLVVAANAVFDLPVKPEEVHKMVEKLSPPDLSPY